MGGKRSAFILAAFMVLIILMLNTVLGLAFTSSSILQLRPYVIVDDFNYANDTAASSRWLIYRYNNDTVNEVSWDPQNSRVYLTRAVNGRAGAIYVKGLDLRFFNEWKVDVIFYIGGGSGADGLAIVFYHQAGVGLPGGQLGYGGLLGYNIEFDTFYTWNAWDPSTSHIALTYNNSHNHLYFFSYTTCPRGSWTYAEVHFKTISRNGSIVRGNLTLTVWCNVNLTSKTPIGDPLVNKTITYDFNATRGLLGFTAATGGLNDNHVIDWFRFEGYPAIIGGELKLISTPVESGASLKVNDTYTIILLVAVNILVASIAFKITRKH